MKKWKKIWFIFSPLLILIISTLIHNFYNYFPSLITKIFFPINESIWEHTKMIIMAYFIFMILENIIFKEKNYNYVWAALVCSILVLIIFSFTYFYILKGKDNLFITIIIYLSCIILSQLYYYFLQPKANNKICIIMWLYIFIMNGLLTIYPLSGPLFQVFLN